MSTSRIDHDLGTSNHADAVKYFNRLLVDMKKWKLGYEHDPVTMERLEEGTKHVQELDQCRRPSKFF
jgi:hypothetical protein